MAQKPHKLKRGVIGILVYYAIILCLWAGAEEIERRGKRKAQVVEINVGDLKYGEGTPLLIEVNNSNETQTSNT